MFYPIGLQDFESILSDGYVYVDKTNLIYNLAHGSGKYFFLSRPRRFGKSLLVSTMAAYFSGRKALFDGLAIADLEKDWIQHPVFRMDLSGKTYDSPEVLQQVFDASLSEWEKQYGIDNKYSVPGIRFGQVIEAAYAQTGRRTVILIDEYDKPIMDNLGNEQLADIFRSQLQGFYSVMKAKDACVKFGFLTGVTKMGKLSVFSGLNNLIDISMDARYTDICGISEKELRRYFPESVMQLAEANGMSLDECYAELAKWYDGYHFRQNAPGVYNPFSLLNTFRSLDFSNYWYETGTPSFLVRFIKDGNYNLDRLTKNKLPASILKGVYSERPNVLTLLYQTGYLTIKEYDPASRLYNLGYPNKEVEDSFTESLSEFYTPIEKHPDTLSVYQFVEDIQSGNVEMLMRRFTAFFADMDYQIMGDDELYFQNTLYVMLKLMGQQVQVERHTSNGRIDALIQTPKYVYILELKRDKNPDDALDQIDEKGYDWPFLADGRKVFKLGANFSTRNHRLENWKVGE
ncbi:MAG: ATP-binding protein [Bacteroidales bacterium]|nr:ATP-binding protein [Bacteroidales bacterium]